uniref:Melanocortin 2 receptor n=1 Tax=Seriola dumerili TaxID=41447 RepID=A0A3B4TKY4_SERDU
MNTTSLTQSDCPDVKVPVSLFFTIGLASLAENFLVVVAVIRNRNLHSPMYCFICSLAAFNTIASLTKTWENLMIVFADVGQLEKTGFSETKLDDVMDSLLCMSFIGSIFSFLAIAVDRYITIFHALRYHNIMTMRRTRTILGVIWTTCGVSAILMEDRSSAHQRREEVSAPAAVGQQHERGPYSHHPVWGVCGLLGAVLPPPHHHHGVPHEPVLRVLSIAVPAAHGAVDEPRPNRPGHLRLPQPRAQTNLQEDAALFKLETVLIEEACSCVIVSTESTQWLITCRMFHLHWIAYIYTRGSTIHRLLLLMSSCGCSRASSENSSVSSFTFPCMGFDTDIKATATSTFGSLVFD